MLLELQQWPLGQIQQVSYVETAEEIPEGEPVGRWEGTAPKGGWFHVTPTKFHQWKVNRNGAVYQIGTFNGLWAPRAPYYCHKDIDPTQDRILLRGRYFRVIGGIPVLTCTGTVWVSKTNTIRFIHLKEPDMVHCISPEGLSIGPATPSEQEFLRKKVRVIYRP